MKQQKKIPLRRCAGCMQMKPKRELIRVVKAKDVLDENGGVLTAGGISLDLTGKKPGRGAYVCKSAECLKTAKKAGRLERSLSCKIPDEVYAQLSLELERGENSEKDC